MMQYVNDEYDIRYSCSTRYYITYEEVGETVPAHSYQLPRK